jgi:hypothetical protein
MELWVPLKAGYITLSTHPDGLDYAITWRDRFDHQVLTQSLDGLVMNARY